MVLIMILHVRSKYTAVGRKEILIFFYMYFGEELLAIFLDSSIIPTSSDVYAVRLAWLSCSAFRMNDQPDPFRLQWFAAIHTGLTCATYWCLLVNGFVGFQVVEDGTPLSLWVRSAPAVSGSLVTHVCIVSSCKAARLSSVSSSA